MNTNKGINKMSKDWSKARDHWYKDDWDSITFEEWMDSAMESPCTTKEMKRRMILDAHQKSINQYRQQLKEKVEGMEMEYVPGEESRCKGYNQALSDVLTLLGEE